MIFLKNKWRTFSYGAFVCVVGLILSLPSSSRAGEGEDTEALLSSLSQRVLKQTRHQPSTVIFPDQYIPLNFDHAMHVDEMGLDCDFCHDTAADSTTSKDRLIPEEPICLGCHEAGVAADEGEASGECSTCHRSYTPQYPEGADRSDTGTALNPPPHMVVPTPHIKMNHKVHIDKGISCETCHREVPGITLATRENALPVMGTCLTCHDNKAAPMDCVTCHQEKPNGKIETEYATGKLKPSGRYFGDTHDMNFYKDHSSLARAREGYCLNCHAKQECVDCHAGNLRPGRVHPANWILIHPVRTRGNDLNCSSCHRSQTFCVSCHEQARVVYRDGPQKFGLNAKFHPEGWFEGAGVRGPNHHAFQAQRNIRVCASCHMEQDCKQCHASKVGPVDSPFGLHINPHPVGFKESCRSRVDTNPVVCKKCHASDRLDALCN